MKWKKPKTTPGPTSTWTTWESKCKSYRVVEKDSDKKFYPMVKRLIYLITGKGVPWWDGLKLGADGGTPLGCKTYEEAVAMCEDHHG